VAAITLRAGQYESTFRPDVAMLCASLRFRRDEYIAWPRTLTQLRAGNATAVPLLHPWANRLARDSYRAAGRRVSLAGLALPRDPQGLPIHGNLFGVPFEIVRASDTRLTACLDYGALPEKLRAFPFPHTVTVDARLDADRGLRITTSVEPTSASAVPISFGWHPYLRLPGTPRRDWELQWPACDHVEVDERIIPTGARVPQRRERAPIGRRTFDDHYALGRERRFAVSDDRRTLTLTFDRAYPFAQLFVPPRRQLVAIEPMTAEIDALGRGTAPVVESGDRFAASFTISVTTS
jgi:galactose mutarotase-like enzyme